LVGKVQCYYSALQHEHIIWGFTGIDYSLLDEWFEHLKVLKANSEYKENIELDAFSYEVMKEKHKKCLKLMKELVKRKQIEIVGGTYTGPPMILIDGESNIRQILLGKELIKKILGVKVRSFAVQEGGICSHPQLPQILEKTGYESCILGCFNGYKFVNAVGIDGTTIPTVIKSYWDALPRDPKNVQMLVKLCSNGKLIMPMPDWSWGAATSEWIKEAKKYRKLKIVIASEFFSENEPKEKFKLSMVQWKRETEIKDLDAPRVSCLVDIANGCEICKANRNAENLLLTAEKYSSILHLLGRKPKIRVLKNCWKKLFMAQAHDIYFDGSIPQLKAWAMNLFRQVTNKTRKLLSDILKSIVKRIDTKLNSESKLIPLIIFNQLPWEREELIDLELTLKRKYVDSVELLDKEGHKILCEAKISKGYQNQHVKKIKLQFVARLPPMGYSTYYVRYDSKSRSHEGSEGKDVGRNSVENKYVRIKCNENGEVEFYDKKTDTQLLKGNFLTLMDQNGYDDSRLHPVNVKVTNSNLTSYIVIKGRLRRGSYKTTITLWKNSPRINFNTQLRVEDVRIGKTVTWWCMLPETALANNFIINIKNGKLRYDYPFGCSHQHSLMIFPLNWIDYSNSSSGVSIFHKGTHAFWIKRTDPLHLMNLWLWSRISLNKIFKNRKILPMTKTFEYKYAIVLHNGNKLNSEIFRESLEYQNPPIIIPTSLHKGELSKEKSFLSINKKGVLLSALIPHSKALLARVYEVDGQETVFGLKLETAKIKGAYLATMDGKKMKPVKIGNGNTISVHVKPYEITNLLLET